MSTDIQALVEVRREGRWRLAEPTRWVPTSFMGHPDPTELELLVTPLQLEQNYELFAILADVRNSRYPIEPITPPRGLPTDASEGALHLAEAGRGWKFCASWLLASELLDHDWSQGIQTERGSRTHGQLATRADDPRTAPLFTEVLATLRSYGDPRATRVLLFFY